MSFVRVPPDSTGKKVYTKQQTVGADAVEVQVLHLADAKYPTQFQAVDKRGSSSVRFAEGQPILSGFGALKTISQRALGVYESSVDTYDDLFYVNEVGGGQSNYVPQESSQVLSVTGAAGDKVSRTTNRYHYYLPGSSNFINMTTACGDTGKAGNKRRWGAFDDKDGVFFELDGTTLYVVIRSSTTGSIVETKVAQADWSTDTVDGLGWSGHTLDITKINVWWIDYQWLGAGRVRFGIFEPSGARLVCHEFENAGAFPLPYMRTGTLPLRTENVNESATGATSELREVCMAMYTEGTYEDYTFWRNSDLEHLDVTVGAVEAPILSVKSKATINGDHNSIQSYPETLTIYTTQPISLSLSQDVVLTGATWSQIGAGSLDADTAATAATGGRRFNTWYFGPGAHNLTISDLFELNDEAIQAKADGLPEIWSFKAKRLTASDAVVSINLGYRELW